MIHKNCEHYVEINDMCLLYFQLGFNNVSQYGKCLEELIYGDEENGESVL